jgi:hypothetical protein
VNVLPDHKDQQDQREIQVLQVKWGSLDLLVYQVQLVFQVQLVLQDQQDLVVVD